MSSVGAVTEDKDQDADDTAQAVCVATGMLLTAVTLVVPTRPMVILGIKGPGESAARIMGLMSASGAAVELLVNPVFGKVCDHYGRKPLMLVAMAINAGLRSMSTVLQKSLAAQFVDRMLSAPMVCAFLAPASVTLADLFAKDPVKLGKWTARQGMYMGIGAALGPFLGAKLGTRKSFLASALMFAATAAYVNTKQAETLAPENRKELRLDTVSPWAFLKLFKCRTLGWLATATALQSFGDGFNLNDINNIFLINTLKYGPRELGSFAVAGGVCGIAGGKVTMLILDFLQKTKLSALKVSTLISNTFWSLAMLTLGSARHTPQAFLALFLTTFGTMRNNSISTYMQTYSESAGLGRAEVVVATANLLAYVKVLAPLLYSNLFNWATTGGRSIPGLPYYVIALMTALAQGSFWLAAPR